MSLVKETLISATMYLSKERFICRSVPHPYVELKDGLYTRKAFLRSSKDFTKLEIYAGSSGRGVTYPVKNEISKWTLVELKNIPVKNGKVEIGFTAIGNASASCVK